MRRYLLKRGPRNCPHPANCVYTVVVVVDLKSPPFFSIDVIEKLNFPAKQKSCDCHAPRSFPTPKCTRLYCSSRQEESVFTWSTETLRKTFRCSCGAEAEQDIMADKRKLQGEWMVLHLLLKLCSLIPNFKAL